MPDGTCIGFSLHYPVHMTKITHIYIIGTIDKSAEAEAEHYQDSSKPPGLQLWFVLWEMIGWQLPLDFTAFIYIDSKFNNELTLPQDHDWTQRPPICHTHNENKWY